jgi:serine/threonine protein kinase
LEPKKPQDPEQLGEWRITGRLGEGGFGTVFLAERGAQKAALKVIKNEFAGDQDGKDKLANEARILSTLSDPSIGRIIDSDIEGVTPWIATEFINGPTLEAKVKYEGSLSEISWFTLAANLFHALVTAHNVGIIHKDIKPSNIILGETGNKLIDFGIAHISGLTRTMNFGDREGSTPFSSPEHFTPKTYPAMDVFSAAATLAYAGKGSSIWGGDTELQLMRSINEDEPNLEGLTQDQINFLLPLLNKNPSDRPTAQETLNVLLKYHEKFASDSSEKGFAAWSKRARRPSVKGSLATKIFSGIAVLGIAIAASAVFANGTWVKTASNAGATPTANATSSNSPASPAVSNSPASPAVSNTPTPKPSSKYGTKDDLATPFFDESTLSQQTLNDTNSCRKLADSDAFDQAIPLCLKSAAAGDPVAYRYLGYSYNGKHEFAKAITALQKAIVLKDVSSYFFLAPLLDVFSHNFKASVDTYKKGLAINPGTNYYAALGDIYNRNKDLENAEKYYLLAANHGEIDGIYDLGKLYYDSKNWTLARTYLAKAANSGSADGMFLLGEIYFTIDRNTAQACVWYEKGDQLKNTDASLALTQHCKGLRATYPDAPTVQTLGIFGRAFKSSDGLDWYIPMTISTTDSIPAINGVQFRVYGSNAPWINVPYKVQRDSIGASALVDNLLFVILFKQEICPDFRLVQETNGQVVTIWTKSPPACATGGN